MLELDVVFTNKCNAQCGFCYNESVFLEKINTEYLYDMEVLTDKIFKVCNLFCNCEVNSIGITGGEPFLVPVEFYDKFLDIAQIYFSSAKVTLTSNGILLNDDLISWIQSRGIYLSLSFEPFFNFYRNNVFVIIDRFLKYFPVDRFSLHFVLRKGLNLSVIFNFIKMCDVQNVEFSLVIPVGRAKEKEEILLTEDEIIFYFDQILSFDENFRFKKFLNFINVIKNLSYGEQVNYNNQIWGSCWNRYKIDFERGEIRNSEECIEGGVSIDSIDSFDHLFFAIGKNKIRRKEFSFECRECKFFSLCRGGCILFKKKKGYSCGGLKKVLDFLYNI